MTRSSFFRIFVAVTAAGLTACAGYRPGSGRPALMEGVKTLAVPLFRSELTVPQAAPLVTSRVVRQFLADGTFPIVDSGKADAVLRGTIRPLRRQQLRGDKRNTLRTVEQEIRLVLDYSVESRSGAVLATGSVEGSSSVYLDANFQRSESQGIDDAAAKLALNLVSRLAEGWGPEAFPAPPPLRPAYQNPETGFSRLQR